MGAFTFSISRSLVAQLKSALPLRVFVETGTFEGDAIATVRDLFDEVHSIELSNTYYEQARSRFAADAAVHLYHGNSPDVVRHLRSRFANASTLFWLDAHWCVADETAGETSQCPLLEELDSIGKVNGESVILIDDARLFLTTPSRPYEATAWPRLQQVIDSLASLGSSHEIMVINDVMVYFPSSIIDSVSSYARNEGVDWLAQMHQLRELEQIRDGLARAAEDRLEAINELTRIAEERQSIIEELSMALERGNSPPS